MLIPTLSKAKLPREMSFPLGAEKLSAALSGVPHFGEMRLCFSGVLRHRKSVEQRIFLENQDYTILSVILWPPFYVEVYPVKRELKNEVREALASHGLPRLREWWLRQNQLDAMWHASAKIQFSPSRHEVLFVEHKHVA